MTEAPQQSKNQIPVPLEDFPDPTDAQLAEIERLREAGEDARAALATPGNGKRALAEREAPDSAASLALLAVGGLSYGINLLRSRAERANAMIAHQQRTGELPAQGIVPDDELAKYALLGLAFKAPGLFSGGASTLSNVVDATAGAALTVASPLLNSRLMKPFRDSFHGLEQRGESVVQGWAQLGQQGQVAGKELVEDATFDVMQNVVEVVAESDEVRDLVQQQTVSLAQEFLGFIQAQLRGADLKVQRIAFKIIPGDQSARNHETSLQIPRTTRSQFFFSRAQQGRAQ